MRVVSKSFIAATVLASLVSSVPAGAANDFRARRLEQIQFFQKLAKFGHPFQLRLSPAALKAAHASRPAALPPPVASSAAEAMTTASTPVTNALPRVGAQAFPGGTTAFYFSAHPDDFSLFTYPYRDVVADDTKVVLIFLTAGDAGLGTGPTGSPYYLARENAAFKGMRFMADASRPWPEGATTGARTVNGRSIFRFAYRSTVAYFLRLPDGNGGGEGFPGTGNVSLSKLQNGSVATLRAINGSTTYRGWSDLLNTVQAIVASEGSGSPNVWVNANDPNTDFNPGDHFDHLATGAVAAAMQTRIPCINGAYHVGYALAGASNLSPDDARNKAGTFAAYATGLTDRSYYGAWDDTHKSWLGGLSARVALGNGAACAF